MTANTSSTALPQLPLTCLNTAEFKNTDEAFEGENTVIDFWTTTCERCPAALDTLNDMAVKPEYASVKFTSIVLDKCDGARNIIELENKPRWKNINHYYMDSEFKEIAKEALEFNQVPFYVVLNDKGEIVQKGAKKQIDFDTIPGIVRPKEEEKVEEEKYDKPLQTTEDRVFCMDDFDF